MISPLNGPVPTIALKSLRFGSAGSVAARNSASDEKVLPGGIAPGRKNTPFRKMLNEVKEVKRSAFGPSGMVWLPRKKLRLSGGCQRSWSRMLGVENGSCPGGGEVQWPLA